MADKAPATMVTVAVATVPSQTRHFSGGTGGREVEAPISGVAGGGIERPRRPTFHDCDTIAVSLTTIRETCRSGGTDGRDGGATVDCCADADDGGGLGLCDRRASGRDSAYSSSSTGVSNTGRVASDSGLGVIVGGARLCCNGERPRTCSFPHTVPDPHGPKDLSAFVPVPS